MAKAHQRQKQSSQLYPHVFPPFREQLNYQRICAQQSSYKYVVWRREATANISHAVR
jgi:hypothetical protein